MQRQPLEEGVQRRQEEGGVEGGKRVDARFLAEVTLVIVNGGAVVWYGDGSMPPEGEYEGEVVELGERIWRRDVVLVEVGEEVE